MITIKQIMQYFIISIRQLFQCVLKNIVKYDICIFEKSSILHNYNYVLITLFSIYKEILQYNAVTCIQKNDIITVIFFPLQLGKAFIFVVLIWWVATPHSQEVYITFPRNFTSI